MTKASSTTWDEYDRRHHQTTTPVPVPHDVLVLASTGQVRVVVDVGCGDGRFIAAMRSVDNWNPSIVGIEYSAVRANRAFSYGGILQGDAMVLPLREGSVDLAFTSHVIEHVPDDTAMLQEMLRIVRPGGHLYIETPLRRRGATYIYRNASGTRVLDPTHVREYGSVEALTRLVEAAGARVVDVQTGPIHFPLGDLVGRALPAVRGRAGLQALGRVPVPRYGEIRVLAQRPVGS